MRTDSALPMRGRVESPPWILQTPDCTSIWYVLHRFVMVASNFAHIPAKMGVFMLNARLRVVNPQIAAHPGYAFNGNEIQRFVPLISFCVDELLSGQQRPFSR